MDAPPLFDHPELFDSKRIRLFDLDGSGPADLMYLGGNHISYWLNLSGNGWSEPHIIPSLSYPLSGV